MQSRQDNRPAFPVPLVPIPCSIATRGDWPVYDQTVRPPDPASEISDQTCSRHRAQFIAVVIVVVVVERTD